MRLQMCTCVLYHCKRRSFVKCQNLFLFLLITICTYAKHFCITTKQRETRAQTNVLDKVGCIVLSQVKKVWECPYPHTANQHILVSCDNTYVYTYRCTHTHIIQCACKQKVYIHEGCTHTHSCFFCFFKWGRGRCEEISILSYVDED